ncbi:unnamed protein product [Pedinophyceae sp. YPF-701]|nr:unnamed protein product [Pedinophyceae sp. YPF-701]
MSPRARRAWYSPLKTATEWQSLSFDAPQRCNGRRVQRCGSLSASASLTSLPAVRHLHLTRFSQILVGMAEMGGQGTDAKDWSSLPRDVLSHVVKLLAEGENHSAIANMRLACKEWHAVTSSSVVRLHPRGMPAGRSGENGNAPVFPCLKALDFSHLHFLRSDPYRELHAGWPIDWSALTEVTLDGNCPFVTEWALSAALQGLSSLQKLVLDGSYAVTAMTLHQIAGMSTLRSLSLAECPRVDDIALAALGGTGPELLAYEIVHTILATQGSAGWFSEEPSVRGVVAWLPTVRVLNEIWADGHARKLPQTHVTEARAIAASRAGGVAATREEAMAAGAALLDICADTFRGHMEDEMEESDIEEFYGEPTGLSAEQVRPAMEHVATLSHCKPKDLIELCAALLDIRPPKAPPVARLRDTWAKTVSEPPCCSGLVDLNLRDTYGTDVAPYVLARLTALTRLAAPVLNVASPYSVEALAERLPDLRSLFTDIVQTWDAAPAPISQTWPDEAWTYVPGHTRPLLPHLESIEIEQPSRLTGRALQRLLRGASNFTSLCIQGCPSSLSFADIRGALADASAVTSLVLKDMHAPDAGGDLRDLLLAPQLEHLRVLDLGRAFALEDHVPDSWEAHLGAALSYLTQLTRLSLRGCHWLRGSCFANLRAGQLPHLRELLLDGVSVATASDEGMLCLARATPGLHVLSIKHGATGDGFWQHVSELWGDLRELDVSHCYGMRSAGGAALARLPKLRYLNIDMHDGNHTPYEPRTLSALLAHPTLTCLVALCGAGTHGPLQPGVVPPVPSPWISELNLQGFGNLGAEDGRRIGTSMRSLRSLTFSAQSTDVAFVDALLDSPGIDRLRKLCRVRDATFTATAELTGAVEILSPLEPTMMKLARLTRLTHLELHDCTGLSDAVMAAVAAHCPRLGVLDISGCDCVTDAGLQALARAQPALTMLAINGCDFCIEEEAGAAMQASADAGDSSDAELGGGEGGGPEATLGLQGLRDLLYWCSDGLGSVSARGCPPWVVQVVEQTLNSRDSESRAPPLMIL